MRRDVIEKCVAELQRVADERLPFGMGSWYDDASRPLDCGTAACALGWLSRAPWAQELGLRPSPTRAGYPELLSNDGFDAAVEFLGVQWRTAVWLFSWESYLREVDVYVPQPREVGAWEVAARMRRLLAEGEEGVPRVSYTGSPDALCDREDLLLRWSPPRSPEESAT